MSGGWKASGGVTFGPGGPPLIGGDGIQEGLCTILGLLGETGLGARGWFGGVVLSGTRGWDGLSHGVDGE